LASKGALAHGPMKDPTGLPSGRCAARRQVHSDLGCPGAAAHFVAVRRPAAGRAEKMRSAWNDCRWESMGQPCCLSALSGSSSRAR